MQSSGLAAALRVTARPRWQCRWKNKSLEQQAVRFISSREILLAEYFRLTREQLPAQATRENWVVTADHCFHRIILDHLFEAPWREHLAAKTPAYKQLAEEQLERAVALAARIEREGDALLRQLNLESLKWRGKLAKPPKSS